VLVSQQAPPEMGTPAQEEEQSAQRSEPESGNTRDRVMGFTGKPAVSSITWSIILSTSVILVTVALSSLILLPTLLFGGDRPSSVKGYLDAITWGWLLINGVPPKLGSATITLIPWGLALIPWVLLFVAGRSISIRTTHGTRWRVLGGVIMVVIYVVAIVAAGHFTTSMNISFSDWWALSVSLAMGVSAVTVGILSGANAQLGSRIPPLAVFVLRRGVGAVTALLGVAAIMLAVRLLANFGSAMDLFMGLNPGWSGILAMLALTIGYAPVLVVWSAAYIVGAGFSIGPDVMVSPFIPVTAPTQLPPFPPLVAIPETAGALVWLLPLLVIGIGVLWGVGISKSLGKESALIRLVIGLTMAFVGAVILYFLALISLGNLGDVRLISLGPDPLLSASLFWILMAVGISPTAVLPSKAFVRNRHLKIAVVPEPVFDEAQRNHE
jgi:hypothetical protein